MLLTILFFRFGGRRALRRGLPARVVRKGPVEVPSFTVSPPSPEAPLTPRLVDEVVPQFPELETGEGVPTVPPEAPISEEAEADDKDLRWVPHDLNSPAAEGIEMDGGVMDEFLSGLDSSRPGTPVSKEKAE